MKYCQSVNMIEKKIDDFINRHPSLHQVQCEIDRLLLNTPSKQSRQDVLDIMYRSKIEELNIQFKKVDQLLKQL